MSGATESRIERVARDALKIAPPADPVALRVPNIVEFATSAEYLDGRLDPRQATVLKLLYCEIDQMTDYDLEVIDEWCRGFVLHLPDGAESGFYGGGFGAAPDVLDRARHLHARGARFRELVFVAGRRGSKSHLAAIACLFEVWNLLALGHPQCELDMPLLKQLRIPVFSGNKDLAVANQFGDVLGMIETAKCFEPLLERRTTATIELWTPAQLNGEVSRELPAVVIEAKEATQLGARGAASPVQVFDEMAHVVGAGSTASAEALFQAAVPATKQFRERALLLLASSPYQRLGQFYGEYQRGLKVDASGSAVALDVLVLQLPSWELYRDADRATEIEMWRGGPRFPANHAPRLTEAMLEDERIADPASYAVEYAAQWAAVSSPYLPGDFVDAIFAPFEGTDLEMRDAGRANVEYFAHADPSVSQANFAFAIGHREARDDGLHVVFDVITVWRPQDSPDHRVDYELIFMELKRYLQRFNITRLSMDQFNSEKLLVDLDAFCRTALSPPRHVEIERRTATAQLNFSVAETFKTAAGAGRIHAARHELAWQELSSLQRHGSRVEAPTSGLVQTSDVADAMMNVVYSALDPASDYAKQLSEPITGMPFGLPSAADRAMFAKLGESMSPGRFRHGEVRSYQGGGNGRPRR